MIAGALEIQLMADVARIRKDMNDAKAVVGDAMGGIERAAGAATKVLGALGIGLSVGMFTQFIKGAIDAQDAMDEMSQRTGVAVETLAGLEHAAKMNGTSLETLEKGMKTVVTQLYSASEGGKGAVDMFATLGISIYDTSGALKTSDVVLMEVSDRFATMENQTEKNALALQLFGKAGLEMVPMLSSGSAAIAELVAEGQRFNPLTAESAAMAGEFNDHLDRLKGTAGSVGVTFANNLLPVLNKFFGALLAFVQSDKMGYVLDGIKVAAAALAVVLTGQMIKSVVASGVAMVTSAGQTLAYQLALAKMAGVSTASAVATTGLSVAIGVANKAMTLMGGPLGAILLAATAAGFLISKFVDAQKETDEFATKVDAATGELVRYNGVLQDADTWTGALERQMVTLQAEMLDAEVRYGQNSMEVMALSAEMADLEQALRETRGETNATAVAMVELTEEQQKANEKAGEYIRTLQNQIDRLGMTERAVYLLEAADKAGADATQDMRDQAVALAATLYDNEQQLKANTRAQEEHEKSVKAAREAVQRSNDATQGVISSLREEIQMLGMSSREQAIWNALKGAGELATVQERIAIAALAGTLYDEAEARRAAQDAATAQAEEVKRTAADRMAAEAKVAENAQKNWERTHEYLSTTFIDIFNNGKNAFDNIAKAFSAMIQRMVAEWAASQLMNLIGIGSGSGGTASSIIGAITGAGGSGGGGGSAAGSVASSAIGQAISGSGTSMLGGAGGSLLAAGGQFISGMAGTAVGTGSAIVGPPTAAAAAGSGIGSSIMAGIGAIPGWGWALAGVAAAAALLAKEATPSTNAGMLVGPAPGASADRQFSVDPFASGFRPVGFARRENQAAAMEVINAFGQVDSALTAAIRAAGGDINMSAATLAGYSETGQGAGVFLGLASEKGRGVTSMPMEQQLSQYAQDVMRHAIGLTQEQKDSIFGRVHGSHQTGLGLVPFDGYIARTHKDEAILTAQDNKTYRSMTSGLGQLTTEVRGLMSVMREMVSYAKKTSDTLIRVSEDGDALRTVTS